MFNKIIGVVGDIFKNVSDGENIFTFSHIIKMIENGELMPSTLFIEQGVSEENVLDLKNRIRKFCLLNEVTMYSYFDSFQRCPNDLTHKEKAFNTLISEPIKQADSTYQSVLMIDERCAELSDHVTGQHIQGMLLMEAARQMTLATLEKYFVHSHKNKMVSYVMNEFQSLFYNYALPVSTILRLKIINIKCKGSSNNRTFTLSISIDQNNKKITDVFRSVSTYDARFIKHQEKFALKNYIDTHFKFENDSKIFEITYGKIS